MALPRNRNRRLRTASPLANAVAAGVIAALIFGGASYAWNWYSQTFGPKAAMEVKQAQARERKIVQLLRPGGREQDLPTILGVPEVTTSKLDGYTRSIFLLEDAAVLAISDASGRVLLTSVTSLNMNFRPTFAMDDGSIVTLWISRAANVQKAPQLAVGFLGANFAYYFEWTIGPSHATNYRQGLYGYAMVDEDIQHKAMDVFYPLNLAIGRIATDSEPIDLGIPELPGDSQPRSLKKWLALPAAQTFRANLLINTVAFQAEQVEPLPQFPAVRDDEIWPYLDARLK